jgi:dUTP pyrophosphatase
MQLPFQRLDEAAALPGTAHPGDAGLDLRSVQDLVLGPGERALVGVGLAVEIPPGHAGLVIPRSGLAARHGITILNAPGLVDAGYRDEIRVLLVNLDPNEPFKVSRGDRIAQLVIQRFESVEWNEVADLDDTDRGLGGWGSTG